jgi:hypothetical protein
MHQKLPMRRRLWAALLPLILALLLLPRALLCALCRCLPHR